MSEESEVSMPQRDGPKSPKPQKTPLEGAALHASIKNSLLKAGAVAELEVARVARDWFTTLGPTYFDRDKAIEREFDVLASLINLPARIGQHTAESQVGLHIAVEVKRTLGKHWVVLGREKYDPDNPDRPLSAGGPSGALINPWTGAPCVGQAKTLEVQEGWLWTGVREAFADPKRRSVWYAAARTAFKAAAGELERLSGLFKTEDIVLMNNAKRHQVGFDWPTSHVVVPVVVLDGLLFGAYTNAKELEVVPLRWAALRFRYRSRGYPNAIRRVIHVVTLDAWRDYLALCSERLNLIESEVEVRRNLTREAVAKVERENGASGSARV